MNQPRRSLSRWLPQAAVALFALSSSLEACQPAPVQGGLMLMINQDGSLVLDELRVRIFSADDEELSSGSFPIEEADLPATLGVSNGRPNATLKVRVSGWNVEVPQDVRDLVIENVPTDQTRAVTIVLSERCTQYVELENGEAVSSCEAGKTCNPETGMCGDNSVDAKDLPPYDAGDEDDIDWLDGSGGTTGTDEDGGGGTDGGSSGGTDGGSTGGAQNGSGGLTGLGGQTAVEQCEGKSSGTLVCEGTDVVACGAETEVVQECDHCASGACYCPEGTYGSSPFSACTPCPPGSSTDAINQTACTPSLDCGFTQSEGGTCDGEPARQFGSDAGDSILALAIDVDGSVYIGGSTDGDLLPNDGEPNAGFADAFIARYWPDGTEDWLHQFGTVDGDWIDGIALDGEGGVYVVGELGYMGDATVQDGFLRKYATGGEEEWTQMISSSNDDQALGVTFGADGNLYVVGNTQGTLPGETSSSGYDAYIKKFTADGAPMDTEQFGTTAGDEAVGIAADELGNLYVIGHTLGALDGTNPNPGYQDAFVRKYDSSLSPLWTRQIGTTQDDFVAAVTVDANQDVYMAGYTSGDLDGQMSLGNLEAYVQKFTADGDPDWTDLFGTQVNDRAQVLLPSPTGGVLVLGATSDPLEGDTDYGFYDVFVRGYSEDGAYVPGAQFGTEEDDVVQAAAFDQSGRLILGGYTEGNLVGINAGGADAFLYQLELP